MTVRGGLCDGTGIKMGTQEETGVKNLRREAAGLKSQARKSEGNLSSVHWDGVLIPEAALGCCLSCLV